MRTFHTNQESEVTWKRGDFRPGGDHDVLRLDDVDDAAVGTDDGHFVGAGDLAVAWNHRGEVLSQPQQANKAF